ncbi:MAG: DUF2273 domain-containing protein [Bacillota bacterium]|mgnify:CR=1 FL=1|nr:DUF2273 domain-containing protein [Bacillota bacterium]HHU60412.1 DUF2273 domain-containing protein [Natronincola sp.]
MVEKLLDKLTTHLGKILGSIIGLVVGWIIIRYGIVKGVFVVLCIGAGFYLGARFDSPNSEENVFTRFLR